MGIEEFISTGSVQNFSAFISACQLPPAAFVLIERLPQQVLATQQERQDLLRFTRLSEGVNFSLYPCGRVFHPDFELRWEQGISGTQDTRVVYLGLGCELPSELPAGTKLDKWQAGLEVRERSYYLFGEYLSARRLEAMGLSENQEGYYAEARIPRLLCYPEKAKRVRLVVREYVSKSTGQMQLFRFLKPLEGGSV